MKKICVIAVWMGSFPNNMNLWVESVKHNSSIDFYIVTDQEWNYDVQNLYCVPMKIDELKRRFSSLVGFEVKLNKPYKICDYKPIYGATFSDITKDYDYWGHCDLDVIFGDIRSFITDELLEKYDKLFEAGFFILYKNNVENNNLYKKSDDSKNVAYSYKKAFTNNYACYFDEYMGMSILDWVYDIRVLRDQTEEQYCQDFSWNSLNFKSYKDGESFIFKWENGKLYKYITNEYSEIIDDSPKEILLCHIQKRHMDIKIDSSKEINSFWIVPNAYISDRPSGALYSESDRYQFEIESQKRDKQRRISNLKQNGIIDYIPHYFTRKKINKYILEEKGFY